MNSALCLSVCLACVSLSWAVTPEFQKKFTSVMNDCIKEHNVDRKAAAEFIKDFNIPETKEQKCISGCFMDKMGYIKDMTVDWEKVKAGNAQKYDTPELVAKANQVADACAKVVTEKVADICEISVPVMKCTKEEAKKMQLTIPDLKFEV